jgi:hypothetical protein
LSKSADDINLKSAQWFKSKEDEMNTANLQLEGLIMAVAAISEAITQKGILTHEEIGQALLVAEKAAVRTEGADLSDSNQAAAVFPIRVLSLANQASEQGRAYTFAQYAELVGRMT